MTESVRVYIEYPVPDPLEGEVFQAAAQPGYRGPVPAAAGDFNYLQALRTVTAALTRLGLDCSQRPEPVQEGEKRFFALTVQLMRGLTEDAVRKALPGFKIENIKAAKD